MRTYLLWLALVVFTCTGLGLAQGVDYISPEENPAQDDYTPEEIRDMVQGLNTNQGFPYRGNNTEVQVLQRAITTKDPVLFERLGLEELAFKVRSSFYDNVWAEAVPTPHGISVLITLFASIDKEDGSEMIFSSSINHLIQMKISSDPDASLPVSSLYYYDLEEYDGIWMKSDRTATAYLANMVQCYQEGRSFYTMTDSSCTTAINAFTGNINNNAMAVVAKTADLMGNRDSVATPYEVKVLESSLPFMVAAARGEKLPYKLMAQHQIPDPAEQTDVWNMIQTITTTGITVGEQ